MIRGKSCIPEKGDYGNGQKAMPTVPPIRSTARLISQIFEMVQGQFTHSKNRNAADCFQAQARGENLKVRRDNFELRKFHFAHVHQPDYFIHFQVKVGEDDDVGAALFQECWQIAVFAQNAHGGGWLAMQFALRGWKTADDFVRVAVIVADFLFQLFRLLVPANKQDPLTKIDRKKIPAKDFEQKEPPNEHRTQHAFLTNDVNMKSREMGGSNLRIKLTAMYANSQKIPP